MGNRRKAILSFIDDIPDSKLELGSTNRGKLYTDDDFRLDNKGYKQLRGKLE